MNKTNLPGVLPARRTAAAGAGRHSRTGALLESSRRGRAVCASHTVHFFIIFSFIDFIIFDFSGKNRSNLRRLVDVQLLDAGEVLAPDALGAFRAPQQ